MIGRETQSMNVRKERLSEGRDKKARDVARELMVFEDMKEIACD